MIAFDTLLSKADFTKDTANVSCSYCKMHVDKISIFEGYDILLHLYLKVLGLLVLNN